MKKFISIIYIFTIMLLLCVTLSSCFFNMEPRKSYKLNEKFLKMFLGSSVDGFFYKYFPWYDNCEDYREKAYIDEEGNLILRLTKQQEEAILNYYIPNIDEVIRAGIKISEDYTEFEFVCFQEELASYPLFLDVYMAFRQLFNGKDVESISVRAVFIDAGTGKVVVDSTLPRDGSFTISFKDFTSRADYYGSNND